MKEPGPHTPEEQEQELCDLTYRAEKEVPESYKSGLEKKKKPGNHGL